MHIVIVEDDPKCALVMSRILSRVGGHQVTITESVESVKSLVRSKLADVVVMDVSLANTKHDGRAIDGVSFARLLRADEQSRGVPVLLATAYAMSGDAERLMRESGADGYFAKPISDPRAFVSAVEACARKSLT